MVQVFNVPRDATSIHRLRVGMLDDCLRDICISMRRLNLSRSMARIMVSLEGFDNQTP